MKESLLGCRAWAVANMGPIAVVEMVIGCANTTLCYPYPDLGKNLVFRMEGTQQHRSKSDCKVSMYREPWSTGKQHSICNINNSSNPIIFSIAKTQKKLQVTGCHLWRNKKQTSTYVSIRKCCIMSMTTVVGLSSSNNGNEKHMQISKPLKVTRIDETEIFTYAQRYWNDACAPLILSKVVTYTYVVYHQPDWQFSMLGKSQQNFLKTKSQTEKACVLW